MADEELRRRLLDLKEAHRADKDGGDAMARDVFRMLREPGEPRRREVRAVLLEAVDRKEERLWGAALDALIREGADGTATALEQQLRSGVHDGQWREQVLLALLRARYAPALDLYLAHIEAGVRNGRHFVLRLLQHLYALDRERALAFSARYFGEHLPAETEVLAGFAQGQLVALAQLDASLVSELVRRTAAISPGAGHELARLMSEDLDLSWVQERLGTASAARLKESLAGTMG